MLREASDQQGKASVTVMQCLWRCWSELHLLLQQFHGRHGKAYLFENTVMNTVTSHKEDRVLMTGLHTVRNC